MPYRGYGLDSVSPQWDQKAYDEENQPGIVSRLAWDALTIVPDFVNALNEDDFFSTFKSGGGVGYLRETHAGQDMMRTPITIRNNRIKSMLTENSHLIPENVRNRYVVKDFWDNKNPLNWFKDDVDRAGTTVDYSGLADWIQLAMPDQSAFIDNDVQVLNKVLANYKEIQDSADEAYNKGNIYAYGSGYMGGSELSLENFLVNMIPGSLIAKGLYKAQKNMRRLGKVIHSPDKRWGEARRKLSGKRTKGEYFRDVAVGEFIVGAGSEAALQLADSLMYDDNDTLMAWNQYLDSDYGYGDVAQGMLLTGLFSSTLGVAGAYVASRLNKTIEFHKAGAMSDDEALKSLALLKNYRTELFNYGDPRKPPFAQSPLDLERIANDVYKQIQSGGLRATTTTNSTVQQAVDDGKIDPPSTTVSPTAQAEQGYHNFHVEQAQSRVNTLTALVPLERWEEFDLANRIEIAKSEAGLEVGEILNLADPGQAAKELDSLFRQEHQLSRIITEAGIEVPPSLLETITRQNRIYEIDQDIASVDILNLDANSEQALWLKQLFTEREGLVTPTASEAVAKSANEEVPEEAKVEPLEEAYAPEYILEPGAFKPNRTNPETRLDTLEEAVAETSGAIKDAKHAKWPAEDMQPLRDARIKATYERDLELLRQQYNRPVTIQEIDDRYNLVAKISAETFDLGDKVQDIDDSLSKMGGEQTTKSANLQTQKIKLQQDLLNKQDELAEAESEYKQRADKGLEERYNLLKKSQREQVRAEEMSSMSLIDQYNLKLKEFIDYKNKVQLEINRVAQTSDNLVVSIKEANAKREDLKKALDALAEGDANRPLAQVAYTQAKGKYNTLVAKMAALKLPLKERLLRAANREINNVRKAKATWLEPLTEKNMDAVVRDYLDKALKAKDPSELQGVLKDIKERYNWLEKQLPQDSKDATGEQLAAFEYFKKFRLDMKEPVAGVMQSKFRADRGETTLDSWKFTNESPGEFGIHTDVVKEWAGDKYTRETGTATHKGYIESFAKPREKPIVIELSMQAPVREKIKYFYNLVDTANQKQLDETLSEIEKLQASVDARQETRQSGDDVYEPFNAAQTEARNAMADLDQEIYILIENYYKIAGIEYEPNKMVSDPHHSGGGEADKIEKARSANELYTEIKKDIHDGTNSELNQILTEVNDKLEVRKDVNNRFRSLKAEFDEFLKWSPKHHELQQDIKRLAQLKGQADTTKEAMKTRVSNIEIKFQEEDRATATAEQHIIIESSDKVKARWDDLESEKLTLLGDTAPGKDSAPHGGTLWAERKELQYKPGPSNHTISSLNKTIKKYDAKEESSWTGEQRKEVEDAKKLKGKIQTLSRNIKEKNDKIKDIETDQGSIQEELDDLQKEWDDLEEKKKNPPVDKAKVRDEAKKQDKAAEEKSERGEQLEKKAEHETQTSLESYLEIGMQTKDGTKFKFTKKEIENGGKSVEDWAKLMTKIAARANKKGASESAKEKNEIKAKHIEEHIIPYLKKLDLEGKRNVVKWEKEDKGDLADTRTEIAHEIYDYLDDYSPIFETSYPTVISWIDSQVKSYGPMDSEEFWLKMKEGLWDASGGIKGLIDNALLTFKVDVFEQAEDVFKALNFERKVPLLWERWSKDMAWDTKEAWVDLKKANPEMSAETQELIDEAIYSFPKDDKTGSLFDGGDSVDQAIHRYTVETYGEDPSYEKSLHEEDLDWWKENKAEQERDLAYTLDPEEEHLMDDKEADIKMYRDTIRLIDDVIKSKEGWEGGKRDAPVNPKFAKLHKAFEDAGGDVYGDMRHNLTQPVTFWLEEKADLLKEKAWIQSDVYQEDFIDENEDGFAADIQAIQNQIDAVDAIIEYKDPLLKERRAEEIKEQNKAMKKAASQAVKTVKVRGPEEPPIYGNKDQIDTGVLTPKGKALIRPVGEVVQELDELVEDLNGVIGCVDGK